MNHETRLKGNRITKNHESRLNRIKTKTKFDRENIKD